jgi:hypothetical protein
MVLLLDEVLTDAGRGHTVGDQRYPPDSFQQVLAMRHGDLLPDSFVR